jgi:hypothetical protein
MAKASDRHRPAKDRLTTAERIVRALLPQGHGLTILFHHTQKRAEAASCFKPIKIQEQVGMVFL